MIEILALNIKRQAVMNIDGDLSTLGIIAVVATVLQLGCLAYNYSCDRHRFRISDDQVWLMLAPWIAFGAVTLISYLFFLVSLLWFIFSKSGC